MHPLPNLKKHTYFDIALHEEVTVILIKETMKKNRYTPRLVYGHL